MEVTQWFDEDVKPEKVGLYEREWPKNIIEKNEDALDYWDGSVFRYDDENGEPVMVDRRWRGLAENPDIEKHTNTSQS